ncbi:MAG: FAD-dependent monooxygenase [Cyanobacteriota bacterium]
MAPIPHARVQGAGPSGALTALALAQAGWTVTLTDPQDSDQLRDRDRAYALTHSSARLLRDLGLWDSLSPGLIPFRTLELWDRGLRRQVSFSLRDLPAACRTSGAVGWILQHRALMAALLKQLAATETIHLDLGQPSTPAASAEAAADLVVAAEGGTSATRQQVALPFWQHTYRQACLTAQVCLRGSADDQAWELFRPEGPLAVLPLGGGRFQVVWSASQATCRTLEALAPSAFLDRLAGVLPDQLQPDALEDQPRAFSVAIALAPRLWKGRTVLVGESGHRCHPVGGQGLNLCWRDTALLARLAGRAARGDLPLSTLPSAYGRRRRLDLLLTLTATDLLVRLYSNRHPLLRPVRHLAMTLLQHQPWVRRLSLTAMTLGGAPG